MKKLLLLALCLGISIISAGFSIKADQVKGMKSYFNDLKKCAVQDDVYKIKGTLLDSDKVSNILYKIGTVKTDFTTVESNAALQKGDDVSLNVKVDHQEQLEQILVEFEIINNSGISNLVQVPLSELKEECQIEENVSEDAVRDEIIDKAKEGETEPLNEDVFFPKQESEIKSFEHERSNEIAITNVDVKKKNSGAYTVNVIFNAPNGVSRVAFPTWTIANGQDDLLWADGVISGNTASFTVDIKDHKFELGIYVTHVYVYDQLGNVKLQGIPQQTMSNEAPVLSNFKIDKIYGQYTITGTVTDDYGIDRVQFPTWTQNNGQDDMIWHNGTIVGNTVTCVIKIDSHSNELGVYMTHVYAYDKAGKVTAIALPHQTMENSKIEIENVKTNVTAGRYTITANIESNDVIESVECYTWTDYKGQDDMTLDLLQVKGNTITHTVDMKDHRYETGIYYTHIYAKTKAGTIIKYVVPTQNIVNEAPELSNFKIDNSKYGQYTITATVTDDYGIDRVQFPTWTQNNGQDDIIWHNGTIDGNTVTCVIKIDSHLNELGVYNTHVYAYDKAGKETIITLPQQTLEQSKIEIENVKTNVTAGRYTITANIESNDVIESVKCYTWTDNKGQDDMTLDLLQVNGNTITHTVDMKDHRYETGIYNTHIYAKTKAGTIIKYVVPTQNVVNEVPTITNIKVIKGTGKYTITANVTDDYELDYVQVHAWTANKGQDDLTKDNVPVTNGSITFTVDKNDHNNETGTYYSHIYAYDKAGMVKKAVIPTQMILASNLIKRTISII